MSMKATEEVVRNSATLLATVDLPDPDPPAIPIIKGLSIVCKATTPLSGTHYAALRSDPSPLRAAGPAMKIRSIAFALLLLGVVACNAFSRGSGTDQNQPTVLQVDNQGFLDMDVYAARSVQRVRLGIAPGNSKTNFTIPSTLVSGLTSLRFIADPIGGSRASVSQEITVAPGDTVVLTIPPV
jgi:hypothetical protein